MQGQPDDWYALTAAVQLGSIRADAPSRFLRCVASELDGGGLDGAAAWAAAQLAATPPHDDATAACRLVAGDLERLLPDAQRLQPELARWREPDATLTAALRALLGAMSSAGIALDEPDLHVVDRLPGPYHHPTLAAVSLDRSDADEYGVPAGVYYARDRIVPHHAESTLGHVLVHTALGQRSPRELGRGLEEGIAEVLGALHCGGQVVGAEAADATFVTNRHVATDSSARETFLGHIRAAGWALRRLGLDGLTSVASEGRRAVKELELELATGNVRPAAPVTSETDRLAARLDALLSRPRPIAVRPLTYYAASALVAGKTLDEGAAELGLRPALCRRAVAPLVDELYLAIVSDQGQVLASDVELLLRAGTLRYALPGRRDTTSS